MAARPRERRTRPLRKSRVRPEDHRHRQRNRSPGPSVPDAAARSTRSCPCCDGNGWNLAGTYFDCGREHHERFDFAGLVLVACPHCDDDAPVVPLRAPCGSVEEASRMLAPLAAMVVSRHVDELGFHRGELRQQRALDRLERLFGYGHHATGKTYQLDRRAVA